MSDTANAPEDATGYGWFEGVFVPTLLTILGVILFLRTGWVMGNGGLAGGVLVIVLSYAITGATALSIASIATNTTIGSGGAYAIIARSLGLEAGGAIGIPLYLSQTLVIALYLFGFRDGWLRIFPDHSALLIDLISFAVLVVIAVVSARFSFRVQFVILALIVAAVISMAFGAVSTGFDLTPVWWGDYPGSVDDGFSGTDFWGVFAVFFPATTGIMAGANMSGELADSRRAIPLGTLLAVGVSLAIYLAVGVWLSASVGARDLVANYLILVDVAAWGPAVLAGLLGATFSSALASIVGAPRILQAVAEHDLLPRASWLAARSDDGEPRHALYVTVVIALGAIALRQLNALAPIITQFFLITYGTINLVVVVEQVLDLPSFRPRLRLPTAVPVFGFLGCLGAMFIVNPVFTAAGIAVVIAISVVLVRRRIDRPFSDVRSALFRRISRWAAERSKVARESAERSWRPNLLVPTRRPARIEDVLPFLRDVTQPGGSVKIVGHGDDVDDGALSALVERLDSDDIASSWSVVETETIGEVIAVGVDEDGSMTPPNIVFFGFPGSQDEIDEAHELLSAADTHGLGVVMLSTVHTGRVGGRGIVNLWVRPQLDVDVDDVGHSHLTILLALKLQRNWAGGQLNLLTVVADDGDQAAADAYLQELIDAARLPGPPTVYVLQGAFLEALDRSPTADANVFALDADADFERMHEMVERVDTPCVFVRGSGEENVTL